MTLQQRIAAFILAVGADMKLAMAQNNFLTVTVDLGYPAKNSGTFLITGFTNLTVGKKVMVSQGTDDNEDWDSINARGVVVDAATIKIYYNSHYPVGGQYSFNYQIQK